MARITARDLEQEAARQLRRAQNDPRRLSALHAAAALAASVLLTLTHILLARGISNTGGLSGIGTRSVYESMQYILQMGIALLLPFWEMGFIYCALGFARGQTITGRDLSAGFRRVGPLLSFWFVQTLIYFLVVIFVMQAASMLYALTPFSAPLIENIEQLLNDPTFRQTGTIPQDMTEQLFMGLLPVYIATGIISLGVIAPVAYLFRLTPYGIFSGERSGALRSILESCRLMWRNFTAFLKLDLHFWWYYLLTALVTLVANLDILLPLLGAQLPLGNEETTLACLALHVIANLLIAWFLRSRVETVYACAYNRLVTREEE